jgi:vitamin B12 transporter
MGRGSGLGKNGLSLGIAAALTAATALTAPRVHAQENAVVLPQIVVSATTVPTLASELGSSVSVITAQDIQQQQLRTVSDALKTVPGLNVVQSGGPGSQTAVFIRGTNANHVKVLIDGIEMSDPSSPNRAFDFGQLLTSGIDRIEVLRGPQSGLYGADAIGGVISITTKKGKGPSKATATLEGGSLGTFNQAGGLSGSTSIFNYAFNAAHFRSTEIPVTPSRILPPGQQAFDNSYDNATYSSRVGADVNENLSFNWIGRYTDSHLLFTGGAVPDPAQSTTDFHQYATRGEAVLTLFDGRFRNVFGVNYLNDWTSTLASSSPLASVNKGDRTSEDWRGALTLVPGQVLVMGVDHYSESARTSSTDARTGNHGAYLELQSEFAKRLFLTANVRNDWNDTFGQHMTYRIAPAVLSPFTETKLKASYGTGFKPPSLFQLFGQIPPFFFGNPALRPETSRGYDYGFEQPLFGDRFRFGITWYNNKVDNEIDSDPTFTTLINVDEASIHGYEAFATLDVTPRFSLRADYTYTHIDATADAAIVRRPPHKYSLQAVWKPTDAWQISATLIAASGWRDFDRVTFATINQDGYTTVNLASSYDVNQHVKVFARIDNLFNRTIENPNGFLQPGFSVFGGIKVSTQ